MPVTVPPPITFSFPVAAWGAELVPLFNPEVDIEGPNSKLLSGPVEWGIALATKWERGEVREMDSSCFCTTVSFIRCPFTGASLPVCPVHLVPPLAFTFGGLPRLPVVCGGGGLLNGRSCRGLLLAGDICSYITMGGPLEVLCAGLVWPRETPRDFLDPLPVAILAPLAPFG